MKSISSSIFISVVNFIIVLEESEFAPDNIILHKNIKHLLENVPEVLLKNRISLSIDFTYFLGSIIKVIAARGFEFNFI